MQIGEKDTSALPLLSSFLPWRAHTHTERASQWSKGGRPDSKCAHPPIHAPHHSQIHRWYAARRDEMRAISPILLRRNQACLFITTMTQSTKEEASRAPSFSCSVHHCAASLAKLSSSSSAAAAAAFFWWTLEPFQDHRSKMDPSIHPSPWAMQVGIHALAPATQWTNNWIRAVVQWYTLPCLCNEETPQMGFESGEDFDHPTVPHNHNTNIWHKPPQNAAVVTNGTLLFYLIQM